MYRSLLVTILRPLLLPLVFASALNAFKVSQSSEHSSRLSSLQKKHINTLRLRVPLRVPLTCRSTPNSIPNSISATDTTSATLNTLETSTSPSSPTSPSTPTSIMMELVSKPYTSFIIDQWGVLHDGKTPYPGVVDCLTNLKTLGKRLILLSNSSKRKESSFKGLNKVGIDSSLFDDIVTSGELAWSAIRERRFDFHIAKNTVENTMGNAVESSVSSVFKTSESSSFSSGGKMNNKEENEEENNANEESGNDGNDGNDSDNSNNNSKGERRKLRVFVIGNNDDDLEYVTSCDCIPSPPEHADFILARGTFCFFTGMPTDPKNIPGTDNNVDGDVKNFSSTGNGDAKNVPNNIPTNIPASDTEHSDHSDLNEEHTPGKISYRNAEHLLASVDPWLARCTERNVPMLVSNPDFHRPGSGAPMPGQIGKKYSALGGTVQYIGKPYATVYDACLAVIANNNGKDTNKVDKSKDDNNDKDDSNTNDSSDSTANISNNNINKVDKSKICCIGDSLDHDIEGARRAGVDSIWTANGVHSEEMGSIEGEKGLKGENVLQGMFLKYGIRPTHTIGSFHW